MTGISSLFRNGFVALPALVTGAALREAVQEFDRLIRNGSGNPTDFQESGNGPRYEVQTAAIAAMYPTIVQIMCGGVVGGIVSGYLSRFHPGLPKSPVGTQMTFEHNDRPGSTGNSAWHFDRAPSVKASLYLGEVDQDSGALQVVPRSHGATRAFALRHLECDPDTLHMPANRAEIVPGGISLGGPAGMVVIFDTYTFHRGGAVTSGERKVVRATTWPARIDRAYHRLKAPGDFTLDGIDLLSSGVTHQNTQNPALLFTA